MSTNEWMDKQNGIHTHGGILLQSLKRNSAICYNMGEIEEVILSEISQSKMTRTILPGFYFHDEVLTQSSQNYKDRQQNDGC